MRAAITALRDAERDMYSTYFVALAWPVRIRRFKAMVWCLGRRDSGVVDGVEKRWFKLQMSSRKSQWMQSM